MFRRPVYLAYLVYLVSSPLPLILACNATDSAASGTPGKASQRADSEDGGDASKDKSKDKSKDTSKNKSAAHSTLPAGHPPLSQAVAGPAEKVKPSGELRPEKVSGLAFSVPKEWQRTKPSSAMRLAQFVVPGPGGAASLAVFRFRGGAGGVEANVDRWAKQFSTPDGGKPEPQVTTREIKTLKVTVVDIVGKQAASSMPGSAGQDAIESARMLALIAEGSGDPYFFKLSGAKATVDLWSESWTKLVDTLDVGAANTGAGKAAAGASKPGTGTPAPVPTK